ncbi:uncharacterized protein LOC135817403 isoform X2 [Sycon ciliatum]|uniref:uncharacterized protein LOC135817403 isoform X2 n=1 Tax=Sycon ciliatum TaxID=27933 RepID=UPI0031F63D01
MEMKIAVFFALLGIASLEAQNPLDTKVTLNGEEIQEDSILTDVKLDDVFVCSTSKMSDLVWRRGGTSDSTDSNIEIQPDMILDQNVVTLSFTAFVEDGIFICGVCNNCVRFAIYTPNTTTRDALLGATSVLALLFVLSLTLALYAIRTKLRIAEALDHQQRENQARRATAIEDTVFVRRVDGPPQYSPDLPQTDRRVLPAEIQAGVWPSFRLAPRSAERREEVHALHSRACSASLRSQSPQAAPSPVGQAPALPPPPPDSPPPQYKEDDDSETSV